MNITLTEVSISKRYTERRLIMELQFKTPAMEYPVNPFFHSAWTIHRIVQQLRGEVEYLDCVGFDDISYLTFFSPWSIRCVKLDGSVISDPQFAMRALDHHFPFPGSVLADWICEAPIGEMVVHGEDELKAVARRYRTRARVRFANERARARFHEAIHGPHRKTLANCVKWELKGLGSFSAGELCELVVMADGDQSFYFEGHKGNYDGPRTGNGGWILHEDGYSAHH